MSKPGHVQINIPAPCPEEWGQMTPCGQGRHCQQCDKTVVDFTTWTDAAIREFFSRSQEHVCGRYHVSQLGRPLHIPPQPHSHLYRMVVAAGLTLLFTHGAVAQTQPRPLAPRDAPKAMRWQRPVNVMGKLTSEHNELLRGALVEILQQGVVKGESYVGRFGYYSLSELMPGTYDLDITYAGCKMRLQNVEVVTGEWTYDIVFNTVDAPVLTRNKRPHVEQEYYGGVRGSDYGSWRWHEDGALEERDSIGNLPAPGSD